MVTETTTYPQQFDTAIIPHVLFRLENSACTTRQATTGDELQHYQNYARGKKHDAKRLAHPQWWLTLPSLRTTQSQSAVGRRQPCPPAATITNQTLAGDFPR